MRARRATVFALLFAVIISVWGGIRFIPSAAAAEQCFPQTGKCASGLFYDYWLANGGLAQQGYPITDAFDEVSPTNGKTYRVQYFERARFEAHPENPAPYNVLLGLLGREQYQAKYASPPPPFPGDPFNNPAFPQECALFPDTGQTVCSLFLAYWRANGGLAQQGLPLTGVIYEVNPTNGKPYPTQYFERARFEYHEENTSPYNVLLGLLGREQYTTKYPGGQPFPAPSSSPSPAPTPPPSANPSPAPSLSPSPSPVPGENFQVAASVSNSNPPKNGNVTVTARLTNNGQGVAGAMMTTTWHYKTTTVGCADGPSISSGNMSCTREIGNAASGYTVVIDVVVTYQGKTFTTSTAFTPQ